MKSVLSTHTKHQKEGEACHLLKVYKESTSSILAQIWHHLTDSNRYLGLNLSVSSFLSSQKFTASFRAHSVVLWWKIFHQCRWLFYYFWQAECLASHLKWMLFQNPLTALGISTENLNLSLYASDVFWIFLLNHWVIFNLRGESEEQYAIVTHIRLLKNWVCAFDVV